MKLRHLLVAGLLAIAAAALPSPAHAQFLATVVSSCGGASLNVGQVTNLFVLPNGNLCTNATGGGGGNGTIVGPLGSQAPDAGVAVTLDTTDAAALVSPVPWLAETAWSTSTPASSGSKTPGISDLQGAPWMDMGAWAGIQVGAPSNFGTSPGAVKVPGVNAAVFAASGDPCQSSTSHSYKPINYSASGLNTTPLIASGGVGVKTYICHFFINNNAAESVGIVETATSASCAGTDVGGIWGNPTHSSSAAGFNFGANGGVALGNGGYTVAQTANTNTDICFIQSGATQLTGGVEFVQK